MDGKQFSLAAEMGTEEFGGFRFEVRRGLSRTLSPFSKAAAHTGSHPMPSLARSAPHREFFSGHAGRVCSTQEANCY